jgi:hypothetical protein
MIVLFVKLLSSVVRLTYHYTYKFNNLPQSQPWFMKLRLSHIMLNGALDNALVEMFAS